MKEKQTTNMLFSSAKKPHFGYNQQITSNNYTRTSSTSCQNNLSLLDRLIDSELSWRHVICEANGGEQCLRQLSELQIKRQEVIHELVQTERHHCLTLALMRQVYLNGLKRLNESRCEHHQQQLITTNAQHNNKHLLLSNNNQPLIVVENTTTATSGDLIDLERLFPALEDLIQAHELFFAHLRLRLVESCNRSTLQVDQSQQPNNNNCFRLQPPLAGLVGPLGDLLCEQFRLKAPQEENNNSAAASNEQQQQLNNLIINPDASINNNPDKGAKGNGYKLLQAYAKFCGQHNDSSRYYKYLMQNDKGFKQFIEVSYFIMSFFT